ncbi:MAG TPA: rhodanese-like domain-containing protein [Burkholderiaceae bacterium]|nr:rhodanese-like domain-containing protein [Burkholderiaceae bacterium]
MKFFTDNWWLFAAAIISGTALIWPMVQRRLSGPALSHLDATRLINDKNAVLVDVRKPDEFASGHIVGSKNVPLDELGSRVNDIHKNKAHPIIVVCATGRRASAACAQLKAAGYGDVAVLDGGIAAWQAAGLPLKQTT